MTAYVESDSRARNNAAPASPAPTMRARCPRERVFLRMWTSTRRDMRTPTIARMESARSMPRIDRGTPPHSDIPCSR